MLKNKFTRFVILGFFLGMLLTSCQEEEVILPVKPPEIQDSSTVIDLSYLYNYKIEKNITIGNYFDYIDQVVCRFDSITPYQLDEYLLIRANHWVIDSLAETDYYRLKEKGQFVFDQKSIVILHKGDSLLIPTLTEASVLLHKQARTVIDINIPEFKLRIKEGDQIIYIFSIRVGQNRKRYLATAKREVDLRTQTGIGEIISVNLNPAFINPVNGKRFTHTRRDDDQLTLMPLIPWLGTEINGRRFGQLIHPSTNPKTLEKAYSNGCIGTKEADAWYIYYYAPLGTKVVIRYDREIINENGDTILLKDIY